MIGNNDTGAIVGPARVGRGPSRREFLGSPAIIGLVVLALSPLGCSDLGAHAVDPGRAQDALKTALDHWKQGDAPGSLEHSPTPMIVQDFEWERGAKLVDYQVLGEGEAKDANLRVKVKLTLAGGQGGSRNTEKVVNYLVGTSPSVTVFRDMLRR